MSQKSRSSDEDISAALVDILDRGMTTADASRKYGISRATLTYQRRKEIGRRKAVDADAMMQEALDNVGVTGTAPNIDLRKHHAAQMYAAGIPMTVIAQKIGSKWDTIKGWADSDEGFRQVCADLRAAAHDAAKVRVRAIAQEHIDHHGAAAKLVRMLLDQTIERMEKGPPTGPGVTPDDLAAWHKATDQLVARALEAARVLNGSPIPGMGGFPKTVAQEVTGNIGVTTTPLSETLARAATSGWVQDLESREEH